MDALNGVLHGNVPERNGVMVLKRNLKNVNYIVQQKRNVPSGAVTGRAMAEDGAKMMLTSNLNLVKHLLVLLVPKV